MLEVADSSLSHRFDEAKLEWIPEFKKEEIKKEAKKVPALNQKLSTL
jgi:hypothetical protein